MVKLTQVDDESAQSFEQQPAAAETKGTEYANEESDDSDDDSDFEDDDIENETVLDRIVALKDIIPPNQRKSIASTASTLSDYVRSGLNASGSYLWIISSSALLLGVPAALAILSELQVQQMEKELTLQQSAQDVLAPGSESAFAGAPEEKKA